MANVTVSFEESTGALIAHIDVTHTADLRGVLKLKNILRDFKGSIENDSERAELEKTLASTLENPMYRYASSHPFNTLRLEPNDVYSVFVE